MKLHFCKIQIKSLFWFQVRAKNNIHNQIKSGASKQPTNILFTISPYVHQRAPKEGVGSISKFTFTCDLKRKKKKKRNREYDAHCKVPFFKKCNSFS